MPSLFISLTTSRPNCNIPVKVNSAQWETWGGQVDNNLCISKSNNVHLVYHSAVQSKWTNVTCVRPSEPEFEGEASAQGVLHE